MKIGIVCYPTYGGSGIVATELGMELAMQGHCIHFISSSIPARLDVTLPNVYFHQVQAKNYPLFEYIPYGIALSTLIVDITKRYKLDVIHAHYAIPHAYHSFMAQQILKEQGIKLPIVTTLHGTDITLVGKHPTYKSGVEFSINKSDIVTSVSEDLKKVTEDTFNIKKEIITIPNFIDNKLYEEETPCIRKNFANDDEKILIHVSNLRPVKRVSDVIEIFNLVQKEIKSKLIIVGEGPEIENIEYLIEKYNLHEKVHLLGKVNQLQKILCLSDVFLLPSELESFGLAALEAMASSTPVITSNAGGLAEVNENNFSGFIEQIGDVQAMANRAIELLSDENKLNKFKQQAKQQALKFDKDKIIPLYVKVYKKVIH
ncbi:MAG: N-acetyl-alpha-D-glucosaminyl L-malate synthase BshA [Flavobacteriales bacterium]|nr:N-acetyl-alpha-D-glucosaminyl L-malate synthase BshA [Flavobacteriales bacterium]